LVGLGIGDRIQAGIPSTYVTNSASYPM